MRDIYYRVPNELSVYAAPIQKILVVGPCFALDWANRAWLGHFGLNTEVDFVQYANVGQIPEDPPSAIDDYFFQVVQVQMRHVLPDLSYFFLEYGKHEDFEALYSDCCARLSLLLRSAMSWNTKYGLPTFVLNFFVPQQNSIGRLLPRYDLRNMVYFFEKLNQCLYNEVSTYKNAYVVDIDAISNSIGRRNVQDDVLCHLSQNFVLHDGDFEKDQGRLDSVVSAVQKYSIDAGTFYGSLWAELLANYRTLVGIDRVKAVLIDLDDTLWRGIAAEMEEIPDNASEGWPNGLMEALCFLKKRGILLGIISKNELSRVKSFWAKITGNHVRLEDFAVVKIDWAPKVENVLSAIQDLNILADSVVFVDDNPVEREAVIKGVPGIRVIGSDPYSVRRILLWSPETQVPFITQESELRTQMIQAAVAREESRTTLSREEFLFGLNLKLNMFSIGSVNDAKFARCLELVNKTNQFNTTGRRWMSHEFQDLFASGGKLFGFTVEDKHTEYGLVGLFVVKNNVIEQFVMSCRVLGLDVELAAVDWVRSNMAKEGATRIEARIVETAKNFPCREVYQRSGFTHEGGRAFKSVEEKLNVGHITIS